MPFGLKNVGATYQRMMNKSLKKQIRRNIEAYVDDMVVKTIHDDSHLDDLWETFATLSEYDLKLNPAKCTFGVKYEKFLGFMTLERGIEANLHKVKTVLSLADPRCVKDI